MSTSDVREDDIGLLNVRPDTEALAPFIRRVSLPVFQNFWMSLKQDLNTSTPIVNGETVEMKAVMNSAGKMVSCEITQRSVGIVLASDRRLEQACNEFFSDPSPPPDARAKDGLIYFIFRSTLHSQPTPRGPVGWLQMQAGLL